MSCLGRCVVVHPPRRLWFNFRPVHVGYMVETVSPGLDLLRELRVCLPIIIPPGGFGGLEVACWPLVPEFAGSNPAEAVGFFRAKNSSARLPSEEK